MADKVKLTNRTWLCCHDCRWIASATYEEPAMVNADGFCIHCGQPAADPFDPDFPFDQTPPEAPLGLTLMGGGE